MDKYKLVPVDITPAMEDAYFDKGYGPDPGAALAWEVLIAASPDSDELTALRANNEWLKKTLAIPPGYRLQPISEFDAMESARIEAEARVAELREAAMGYLLHSNNGHYRDSAGLRPGTSPAAERLRAALEQP